MGIPDSENWKWLIEQIQAIYTRDSPITYTDAGT
jgi:hypothetical protein